MPYRLNPLVDICLCILLILPMAWPAGFGIYVVVDLCKSLYFESVGHFVLSFAIFFIVLLVSASVFLVVVYVVWCAVRIC